MSEHPIVNLLDGSMGNLKKLVDVNSIIGDPILTADGTTIIPISKVSFGFASGGTDLPTSKPSDLFGGGSGGGVTIQPIAFLVVKEGRVDLLHIATSKTTADRVVNMVPEVIDKITELLSDSKKKKESTPPAEEPEA